MNAYIISSADTDYKVTDTAPIQFSVDSNSGGILEPTKYQYSTTGEHADNNNFMQYKIYNVLDLGTLLPIQTLDCMIGGRNVEVTADSATGGFYVKRVTSSFSEGLKQSHIHLNIPSVPYAREAQNVYIPRSDEYGVLYNKVTIYGLRNSADTEYSALYAAVWRESDPNNGAPDFIFDLFSGQPMVGLPSPAFPIVEHSFKIGPGLTSGSIQPVIHKIEALNYQVPLVRLYKPDQDIDKFNTYALLTLNVSEEYIGIVYRTSGGAQDTLYMRFAVPDFMYVADRILHQYKAFYGSTTPIIPISWATSVFVMCSLISDEAYALCHRDFSYYSIDPSTRDVYSSNYVKR